MGVRSRARVRARVGVIHCSRSVRGAYGPQQELLVLQRYGLAYKPRAVVWQLFAGNDLNDAEAFAEWKQNPQHGEMSFKERYFNNSLLHEWLTNTREQEYSGPTATLRYHDGTERRIRVRYPYEPDQPLTMRLGMTETLMALVRARKGALHAPKQLVFTEALPQTALGKIDKKALRAQEWAGSGRNVA